MIRKTLLAICLTLLFNDMVSASAAWEGTVIHVQDGDSFRVSHGRSIETIRLYGIDCPEYRQSGGQQAKKMTTALLRGQQVRIQPMDIDRYDRTVAVVTVRGQMLNAELVRSGWAWVYRRYCDTQPLCRQFEELERDARKNHRGIWEERRPVPPWEWKHRTH